METQSEHNKRGFNSRIADFYDGKTIFVTGAAGYLGVVLLEILLRCCPGICRIYVLLREKKGLDARSRKEQILKKKIFEKLRERRPDIFDKVHVVPGDVTLHNLGMNETDALKVAQEASIVFHCAATISFLKPLRFVLIQNAVGTDNVVEFCRKLKTLETLVYTSTAYSNSNRKDEIEEIIYRLPLPAQRYLDELKNGDDESIKRLVSQCSPKWPNAYTFSKCLAENILADKASDLPVAIVRPSIIISVWKGVVRGYVEEGSGMVGLSLGIGKGFIRVLRVDTEKKIDHIPVDIVANAHVAAAWCTGTNRAQSPFVLNCTSSDVSPCTWGKYINTLFTLTTKYPLPKAYQHPRLILCKNSVYYFLLSIFEHYVPALAIDGLLTLSGRKPKLVSLYRFLDKSMESIQTFVMNEWKFSTDNFKSLTKKMDDKDSEMFYVDLKGYSIEELTKDLPKGAPFYQWDIDRKQFAERMKTTYIRNLLTSFIKWVFLIVLILILFMLGAQIYQRCLS